MEGVYITELINIVFMHSDETKAKIVFMHSDETKAKIRAKALGRRHTSESIAKMREAHKGKRNNLGKHWSPETKEKMRIAHLGERNPMFGKHLTEETKAKLRISHGSGENNPLWKGEKASTIAGHTRAVKKFKCPDGLERHHIDGNPLNNSPENIVFVTRREHMEMDGRMEKVRRGLWCQKK